jgi:hypothetical protein
MLELLFAHSDRFFHSHSFIDYNRDISQASTNVAGTIRQYMLAMQESESVQTVTTNIGSRLLALSVFQEELCSNISCLGFLALSLLRHCIKRAVSIRLFVPAQRVTPMAVFDLSTQE